MSETEFLYKVVVIGNSGVGKTNLFSKLCLNKFEPNSKPTIGVDFFFHDVTINDHKISIQFWDTAG